jgi:hypothetical protein
MQVNIDHLVGGMGQVDPSGGMGNKIKVAGRHRVKIDAVRAKPSEKRSSTYYIVEFTVLESSAIELTPADHQSEAAQAGMKPSPIRIGGEYSWSHDLTNKWFGKARLKQFLMEAVGLDEASADEEAKKSGMDIDTFWADLTKQSLSNDQPFTGLELVVETAPIVPENSGKPFVVHTWFRL